MEKVNGNLKAVTRHGSQAFGVIDSEINALYDLMGALERSVEHQLAGTKEVNTAIGQFTNQSFRLVSTTDCGRDC